MTYVYVASSWKNTKQPLAVSVCKRDGYEVFDFQHPAPGNNGFHWASVDPHFNADHATVPVYEDMLEHPIMRKAAALDIAALNRADVVLLVLPAGNDSHLELGHAIGARKIAVVWVPDTAFRAGLMYSMADYMSHDLESVMKYISKALARLEHAV